MSQLWQDIEKVPGLTGTWRQKLDQYSQKLYGKKWDGEKNTGIQLQNEILKGNYGPQAAPQAPAVDPIQLMADQALAAVKNLPTQTFADQYGTEAQYEAAQKPLIDASVAAQTNALYLPQLDKGIQDVRTEFANRGLFRSGARGKAELGVVDALAQQENVAREDLYGTEQKRLSDRYAKMQADYENTLKTGTTYTGANKADFTAIGTPQQQYTPVQTAGDRYSMFSAGENQSPTQSKYAQAYKSWYENKFKKTRPDVNYNIY